MNELKHINVVAAIIIKDGKLFATQRGYGEWKDWWEFPGGKIEPGEAPKEALKREIREELAAEIEVGDLLTTVEYDYPKFHLTMHCYLCHLKDDTQPQLLEHEPLVGWKCTNSRVYDGYRQMMMLSKILLLWPLYKSVMMNDLYQNLKIRLISTE